MVDYTVGIGGSSTMMIRDTGGWVEFWFQTGSQTYNYDQQWSYSANGGYSGTLEFRLLRGGNWQKFGAVYVQYDQNVSFTVYNAGLGFPTYTFTHHISRSTVPPPPNLLSTTPISSTQVQVIFQSTGDGGSTVVEWQIGYGPSSTYPTYLVGSSGTSIVQPFVPGQRTYFWARGRNAVGWSAWSNRREATTWSVPIRPVKPAILNLEQTSVTVRYLFGDRGSNAPILERQIGYGTDINTPTILVSDADGVVNLTNLTPGGTYYVWGRSRNSVGWSAWSERTEIILIAGARVLVGTEWKRAVPYVNVGGTWKVARPWVKKAGVWRKTSM